MRLTIRAFHDSRFRDTRVSQCASAAARRLRRRRLWRGGFAAAADAHCETRVSRKRLSWKARIDKRIQFLLGFQITGVQNHTIIAQLWDKICRFSPSKMQEIQIGPPLTCVIKFYHIPTSWQRSRGVAFFGFKH